MEKSQRKTNKKAKINWNECATQFAWTNRRKKKKNQIQNVCQQTSSAENNSIKCGDTQASTFLWAWISALSTYMCMRRMEINQFNRRKRRRKLTVVQKEGVPSFINLYIHYYLCVMMSLCWWWWEILHLHLAQHHKIGDVFALYWAFVRKILSVFHRWTWENRSLP